MQIVIIIIIHSTMIRHKPALFLSSKLELNDNRHPITGLEIEEKIECYFFLVQNKQVSNAVSSARFNNS